MNINDVTILKAAAASSNPKIQKALDDAMPNQTDWWAQDFEPAPRKEFEYQDQDDHISAGIDAVEVTEEETTKWRIEECEILDPTYNVFVPGKMCVFQGATHHSAVLDAQTVKYFRRCARQLIHEGRYPGAENCWRKCMGEGPVISRVSLNKALRGWTWAAVGEQLTEEEMEEGYRQSRSHNSKLKKDRL